MNLLRRLLNLLRPEPDEFLSSLRPASETAWRCNDFVTDFCESDRTSIEIAETSFGTDPNPVFKHLHGASYREIRNRFRVLSNLDPVVNRAEEIGQIRMSYRIGEPNYSDEPDTTDEIAKANFRDVELRTVFPGDNTRFQLQKLKIGAPYKYPAA